MIEQTVCSTSSVWLNLYRLFDGASKVSVKIQNYSFAEVTKKQIFFKGRKFYCSVQMFKVFWGQILNE